MISNFSYNLYVVLICFRIIMDLKKVCIYSIVYVVLKAIINIYIVLLVLKFTTLQK